eukprot:15536012-Heterocapsa_arctica.AAC.1
MRPKREGWRREDHATRVNRHNLPNTVHEHETSAVSPQCTQLKRYSPVQTSPGVRTADNIRGVQMPSMMISLISWGLISSSYDPLLLLLLVRFLSSSTSHYHFLS